MADRFAAFAPQLIRDNASRRVGDVVKCVHLTSDAGMALNGAVGRVVGVGSLDDATVAAEGGAPFRVKVEFDGIPEIKSIRTVNLVHPNHRPGPGRDDSVRTSVAREMVRDALARREGISAEEDRDRSDILDRVDAASAWLEKTEGLGARDDDDDARPPIVVVQRCGVLGRPPTGKPGIEAMMQSVAPGCVGDGDVVFERFGDGIVGVRGGAEGDDACAVCRERVGVGGGGGEEAKTKGSEEGETKTPPSDADAMGLPCRHVFHRGCLAPWFATCDAKGVPPSCPECRQRLPLTGEAYAASYDPAQLLRARYREFLIGGMCECCQATHMESDPQVYLDCHDGTPPVVVQRSELPPEARYDVRYSQMAIAEMRGSTAAMDDGAHADFPRGFTMRRCQGELFADEDEG